jgi:hypothetical protein
MSSRVVGNSLRVISGGGSNHSALALFLGQREQLVQRASLFESSSSLLIVQLEKDGIVRKPGKCFGVRARRDANIGADPA